LAQFVCFLCGLVSFCPLCFDADSKLTQEQYSIGVNTTLASINETIEALHEIGAVDKQTMREFNDTCLSPIVVFAPDEIKAIRIKERISQPVFARYLNVSKNLVSDWERGIKKSRWSSATLAYCHSKEGA